jgi:hypothetical protein
MTNFTGKTILDSTGFAENVFIGFVFCVNVLLATFF